MKQTILTAILIIATALSVFAEGNDGNTMEKAIDKQNMDTAVKPGDNFYEYVNGGWIKTHPIPPEYSQYGAFTILYEDNQEKLRSLIKKVSAEKDAAKGSVAQKIRDFYNSGMNTASIEKEGINPIKKDLKQINELKTKDDAIAYMAMMHRKGMSPLFNFFAEADQRNSTMEIANLYQGGLGLPDVDYYINEDESSAKLRDAYVDHLTKMFVLTGEKQKQAEKSAKAVMNFETKLAKTSFTRIEQRDPVKNYNKMSLAGLNETAPDFNWSLFFKTLGLEYPGDINVGQVKFFKGVSDLMNETDMETWKAYLTWNLLDASANYLSDDFVKQNFEFYGKTLSGQQEMQPRWKRVLSVVSNGLGEALGQLYVEEYFPASSKERMVTMVNNLRAAFGDRIKQLDWMTGETKEKALEKLTAIPSKPLLFLNIDAVPGSRALIWEHIEDSPGVPCPNPRVVIPRSIIPDIVAREPVSIDIRSMGIRTPPCTREQPTYGIIGMVHVRPPASIGRQAGLPCGRGRSQGAHMGKCLRRNGIRSAGRPASRRHAHRRVLGRTRRHPCYEKDHQQHRPKIGVKGARKSVEQFDSR